MEAAAAPASLDADPVLGPTQPVAAPPVASSPSTNTVSVRPLAAVGASVERRAEADSGLTGHGGDPFGPEHRRELAKHAW